MARGIDGETSIRIQYGSPPPRSEEDATAMLTADRALGQYRPRHTPPDACAAQDVVLNKAGILSAAIEAAKAPRAARRDSGMNDEGRKDGEKELPIRVSDSEDEDRFQPELPSPKLPFRAPPPKMNGKRTSTQAQATTPSNPMAGFKATPATHAVVSKSATPDLQSSFSSQNKSTSPDNRSSRRRTRTSVIRDDLNIDGTSKLDPTRPETDFEEVRLFKGNSRAGQRWFEWTGEGRPEWALDEKVERRPIQKGKRRQSSWLRNRND